MNEDFLANVKKEGDTTPFDNLEKDTPPASPTDKEPVKDEPQEGDNTPADLPFHKHPRWIERENELKSLRERDEERAKEIADLKAFKEETSKRYESDSEIPDWFKELYGDNKLAWQKYEQHEKTKEEEIERRVIEKQQQATQQAAAETQHWNKWVDDELEKLKAEGNQFDRNELIKTMLDYRPTDENNNFDFKKGFAIYEALKSKEDPAKSIARKQLADATTTSTKGEPAKKDYSTAKDLRHRSWANL